MSSRRIEDTHNQMLDELLKSSGLECVRSTSLTEEEEEEYIDEEIFEEEEGEITPELILEEEEKKPPEEVIAEELPYVFPSPSLRRVVPERLRRIEHLNQIKVLPDKFNTFIDPAIIPKINTTPRQRYIDFIADLVGCTNYKNSLAEYWFLDTLANLLRRAQEEEMPRPSQAVLILWFCEWMKEMQHFDAATRERMLKRWQENMLNAARYIGENETLPDPEKVGVYYKAKETEDPVVKQKETLVVVEVPEPVLVGYECALRDLTKIVHYVYDLFSTDFQYNLVRSIFTFSPDFIHITAPSQIQVPKRLYIPLKGKPPKAEKKEKPPKPAKGKKVEPDNEEYIALMALKEKERRELEELEELDREEWNKKSHILPLSFAATDELFNKYWVPTSPNPELPNEADAKNKEKEQGKEKDKKGKK